MVVQNRGQKVLKEDLIHISNNYIITKHARERINSRNKDINLTEAIRNPLLAYFNTDGSINIAITPYEYFVIATDTFPYKVVTYKEQSWYGIDIYAKREMAKNGIGRKDSKLVESGKVSNYIKCINKI